MSTASRSVSVADRQPMLTWEDGICQPFDPEMVGALDSPEEGVSAISSWERLMLEEASSPDDVFVAETTTIEVGYEDALIRQEAGHVAAYVRNEAQSALLAALSAEAVRVENDIPLPGWQLRQNRQQLEAVMRRAEAAGGFSNFLNEVATNPRAMRQFSELLATSPLANFNRPRRDLSEHVGALSPPPRPTYLELTVARERNELPDGPLAQFIGARNLAAAQAYEDAYEQYTVDYVSAVQSAESFYEVFQLGAVVSADGNLPVTVTDRNDGSLTLRSAWDQSTRLALVGRLRQLSGENALFDADGKLEISVEFLELVDWSRAVGELEGFALDPEESESESLVPDELPEVATDAIAGFNVTVAENGAARVERDIVGGVTIAASGNREAGQVGASIGYSRRVVGVEASVTAEVAFQLTLTPDLNGTLFHALPEQAIREMDLLQDR